MTLNRLKREDYAATHRRAYVLDCGPRLRASDAEAPVHIAARRRDGLAARGARAAAGADATDRLPAGCTTARARPRGIPARACQSRLGARTQFRAGHAM